MSTMIQEGTFAIADLKPQMFEPVMVFDGNVIVPVLQLMGMSSATLHEATWQWK
jgi:hypothetical protein